MSTGESYTETEWIPDPAVGSTPPIDPVAVAYQAENALKLPSPTIRSNPSGSSIVNLPTWLWIDPAIWHPYSVTASAGSVSATAVATPTTVTWGMGDGGSVTCDGPGTEFDLARPSFQQDTNCEYTYAVSSIGQPSESGNGNDAAFDVKATIHWTVSWSATGVAAGGVLPGLTTSESTPLRVEQVESIDSAPSPVTPVIRLGLG
jgi:hypothetical protein